MKSISFVGIPGGDGECFIWSGLSKEDKINIIGQDNYDYDLKWETEFYKEYKPETFEDSVSERMGRIYPSEVLESLGAEDGKKYRFVISVEEVV